MVMFRGLLRGQCPVPEVDSEALNHKPHAKPIITVDPYNQEMFDQKISEI